MQHWRGEIRREDYGARDVIYILIGESCWLPNGGAARGGRVERVGHAKYVLDLWTGDKDWW